MPVLSALEARILLTLGHFVATCLTAATAHGMEGGVAFVIFASFALALVSFVGGWELFSAKKNTLHAVAHCIGGLLQARIVLYDLSTPTALWYVVLLAHTPATIATLDSFARVVVFPHASRV